LGVDQNKKPQKNSQYNLTLAPPFFNL